MKLYHSDEVARRRALFQKLARGRIGEVVNPDGSGKIPQFNPPWREVFWIAPALYCGDEADIALANRMIGRYFSAPRAWSNEVPKMSDGRDFNIFLSTSCATLLREFAPLATPEAREILEFHTRLVFRTYAGAAQPDLKFHGCNDNMPMMATKGLLLGGEFLGDEAAQRHGLWNLNEFRRLLSRSAWASEFNSSTYSASTLCSLAKIGELSHSEEVRALARDCEARIWAEILLHFHPGTRRSAGPNCRSYAVDWAGHPHSLQVQLWMLFGAELSGYDIPADLFGAEPDPLQVVHFGGNYMQNIAEFCEFTSADYHVPEELVPLLRECAYPARTRGRSESMMRYDGMAGEYHTENYMEQEFSLGTVDTPLCGGEQTAQLYATYKLRPDVRTYRDSASIFYRFFTSPVDLDRIGHSVDGNSHSEENSFHQGWSYVLQKRNTAILLNIPALSGAPLTAPVLKLDVIFPAHYGRIRRSVFGAGPVREGAAGESAKVVPVSVEAGEVFVHVWPLIPTSEPRRAAVRFHSGKRYECLELVNYEGEPREFSREELKLMQNGFVFTIDAKSHWESLEAFHAFHSEARILDYTISNRRFVRFHRPGVQFEICYSPSPFGVQTCAVDGRTVERPVIESTRFDVTRLPFTTGEVAPDLPFFPWGDSMKMHNYPDQPWQIGSRGLPQEAPYAACRTFPGSK